MAKDSRHWWPSPLLLLSVGVHVAAPVVWVFSPYYWPWIVGVLVLNHTVLTMATLLPRSSLLGPNLSRLPAESAARSEVALTFDDGPDPDVTPKVLDILEQSGARATFFCVGSRATSHPGIVAEIARRGHLVENHSLLHSNSFAFWGPRRLRVELDGTQEVLHHCTGRWPRFFRAPAGIRGPFLDFVLSRCGLELVSWTHRGFDTVSRDSDKVLKRLTHNLAPGDVLLMHDGSSSLDPGGEPLVLRVLPELLESLARRGLTPAPFQT